MRNRLANQVDDEKTVLELEKNWGVLSEKNKKTNRTLFYREGAKVWREWESAIRVENLILYSLYGSPRIVCLPFNIIKT